MPPQAFLDKISLQQKEDPTRISKEFDVLEKRTEVTKKAAKRFLGMPSVGIENGTRGIERLLSNYCGVSEKDDAVALLKSMLKWDYDERIDVQGILESRFIKFVLDAHPEIFEESYNEEDCESIRAELGEVERNTNRVVKNDTLSDSDKRERMGGLLKKAIEEQFGYVEEWNDHYEY